MNEIQAAKICPKYANLPMSEDIYAALKEISALDFQQILFFLHHEVFARVKCSQKI